MLNRRVILCLSLLFGAFVAYAQRNSNLFYTNGQRRFKGDYSYAYTAYNYGYGTRLDPLFDVKQPFYPYEEDSRLHPVLIYKGKCTFFYEDGNRKAEGTFLDGARNGLFSFWHTSGKLAAKKYYDHGMPAGKWQFWYEDGKQEATLNYVRLNAAQRDSIAIGILFPEMAAGKANEQDQTNDNTYKGSNEMLAPDKIRYENLLVSRELMAGIFGSYIRKIIFSSAAIPDGVSLFYGPSGNKKAALNFAFGTPVGTWNLYAETGVVAQSLTFDSAEVILVNDQPLADYIAKEEGRQKAAEKLSVFRSVEQMPEFPGGQAAMIKFIENNLRPLTDTTAAKVIVSFVVNIDGSLNEFKINKSFGKEVDDEVIRLLQSMPAWKPGKQNGNPVRVIYTLPVFVNRKRSKN